MHSVSQKTDNMSGIISSGFENKTEGIILVLCKTLKYPHLKHSVLFCSADIAELWKLQKRANEMVKGVTKVLHGKNRPKSLGPFTWER